MEGASKTIVREISFSQELEISLKLIKNGLAYLQNNDLYEEKHFIYMVLLSGGIERLGKIILYLSTLKTDNRYLTAKELRKWGHDLEVITTSIIDRCFVGPYMEKPFAVADREFLAQDENFRRMLHLLSEFAKRDRYIYMDGMVDPSSFRELPEMRWEEFQTKTLSKDDSLKSLDEEAITNHARKLNQNTVIHVEKMMRALARLFVFGVLGTQGTQFSSRVREFSIWEDEKFGTKKYEF